MSSDLADRYTLYKEGTKRVTRWLVTTATACRRSSTAKTKRGFVSTKELRQYTSLIVSWKPPIEIPANIIELIEDVIIGRKICANFYAAQDAADVGHEAFIEALEEIWHKLEDARSKNKRGRVVATKDIKPKKEDTASDQRRSEALQNLFENLQLEDPSEEVWNTTASKRDLTRASSPPPTTSPELDVNHQEERRFALFCFLRDMFDIRELVTETWQEAHNQKLSYVTAATLTETAFGFIQRAHINLVNFHPSFDSDAAIIRFLGAEIKVDQNTSKPLLVRAGTHEELTGDIVELLCPYGVTLTRHFVCAFDSLCNETSGEPTSAQPSDCLEDFSFHPFAKMLHGLLPGMHPIAMRQRDEQLEKSKAQRLPVLFETLRRGAGKVHTMHLSMMFEVYMHIHDIMSGRTEVPVRLLAASCRRSKLVSARLRQVASTYKSDSAVRYLAQDIKCRWPTQDFAVSADYGSAASPDDEEISSILTCIPALAAEQIDMQLRGSCRVGITTANTDSAVLSMAHLYRAVQHANTLTIPWPDMDWILMHHGAEKLLAPEGKPGESIGTFLRRYALATGIPVSFFADSRTSMRTQATPLRMQKPRKIETASEFLQAAHQVVASDTALGVKRGNWTEVALQKIALARREKDLPRHQRAAATHAHAVTSIELLRLYKSLKIADETESNFEYLSFWLDLAELFVQIKNETRDALARVPPFCGKADSSVTAPILLEALEVEHEMRHLDTSSLAVVGRILEQYIAAKGASYIKSAEAFKSGEVPQLWIEEEEASSIFEAEDDFEVPPGDWDFERGFVKDNEQSESRSEPRAGFVMFQVTVEDGQEVEDQIESGGPDGWPVMQHLS